MYYFLKTSDFNLESNDFDIDLSPKLSKKELQFLKVLIDKFDSNSIISKISLSKLEYSKNDLEHLLESLIKKNFKCTFLSEGENISTFYFCIFNILVIENNELLFDFTKAVKQSLINGNIFSRVGIISHLQFNLSYTKIIYKLLLKENKHKGSITLSLDGLKEILQMDHDKYPRFYDFETKVLNPIAKDIEISDNFIWFEKIKDSNSKSGKITGVRIHYSNLYHQHIHRDTNNIIRDYAEYIEDFTAIYDKIYQHIKKDGFEEFKSYLEKNTLDFFKN